MNLLIHDLSAEEFSKISAEYEGWNVIACNDDIHPCIGCFSCWRRDPGVCAIKDGYENMGCLIHHSDEVVVISKYTYGGFSGAVKSVFDRSLGFILPQFEVVSGESHHKKRYDEDKPFTFIFYGQDLNDEKKNCAKRYVTAVCTNIRGYVKDVIFREFSGQAAEEGGMLKSSGSPEGQVSIRSEKVVLLNGSMRVKHGNSSKFAFILEEQLKMQKETIALKDFLDDMTGLVSRLKDEETIILCTPLYVDGLHAKLIKLLERFRDEYRGGKKRIYILANMGLYESSQLVNLFEAVRQWCAEMGFEYCGGLGISAGELLGAFTGKKDLRSGVTRKVAEGIDKLAEAVNAGTAAGEILAGPYRFPRWLYITIANANWNRLAKKAGIKPKEMYRRL